MQEISIQQLHHYFLLSSGICTDTRNIKEKSLFVALKGENFDGNTFVEQAIKSGAKFAITNNIEFADNKDIFYVSNTLDALQALANYHRKQFNIPVIAITGSNGKTTTKELFNAVLSKKFNTLATKGNLNNHIGVPLTLLQIKPEHQLAIIEMGANHQGEIELLSHIAEPSIGVITNIGKAHLEGFGGIEGVIKGKTELYKFLQKNDGLIMYNADNAILKEKAIHPHTLTYAFKSQANCVGKISNETPYISINYSYKNEDSREVNSNLIGVYNAENILAAICIGRHLGVTHEHIEAAISSYAPDNSRSQIITKENFTIILDAYNANPSSMKAALDNFAKMQAQHKMVILGDMFELGETSSQEHLNIINETLNGNFQQCIFIGPRFGEHENSRALFFPSIQNCSEYISKVNKNNYTILIKGSRSMKLETLLSNLN